MKNLALFAPLLLISCMCRESDCPPEGVVCQTYVHKYGVEVPSKDWSERGKDGHVISVLSNGVRVDQTYVRGVLNGDTTYSFPHQDTVEKREHYAQDVLMKETLYFANGKPCKEIVHKEGDCCIVTEWYETGSPQCVEEYTGSSLSSGNYYMTNNQVESRVIDGKGLRTVRDPFGHHLHTEAVQNGVVTAQQTLYPNGTPKEQTTIVNGQVHGEKRTFLPTGEPNTIEAWEGNKQHGITSVYQNGVKVREVPYENGVKDGVEVRFKDGEIVVEEISWVNNMKHGPSYTYVQGTKQTEWFYKDRPVTKAMFDQLAKGNNPSYRPSKS